MVLVVLASLGGAVVWAEAPIRIVVNGQELSADVPPTIADGRVMVPVRFVAQALGAAVSWDDATRTVYITGTGVQAPPLPADLPSVRVGDDLYCLATDFGGSWQYDACSILQVDHGASILAGDPGVVYERLARYQVLSRDTVTFVDPASTPPVLLRYQTLVGTLLPANLDELSALLPPFSYFWRDGSMLRGIVAASSYGDTMQYARWISSHAVPLGVPFALSGGGTGLTQPTRGAVSWGWTEAADDGIRVFAMSGHETDIKTVLSWARDAVAKMSALLPEARLVRRPYDVVLLPEPTPSIDAHTMESFVYVPAASMVGPSSAPAWNDDNWYRGNLAHEFCHAVTFAAAARYSAPSYYFDSQPAWFREGLAELCKMLYRGNADAAALYPDALGSLASGGIAGIGDVYRGGAVTLQYMYETIGLNGLRRIIDDSSGDFWTAIKSVTGMDEKAFDAALRAWASGRR